MNSGLKYDIHTAAKSCQHWISGLCYSCRPPLYNSQLMGGGGGGGGGEGEGGNREKA